MHQRSPVWPARLDHIRLDSDEPSVMVDFYRRVLGMSPTELGDGSTLMSAPGRHIVIGPGQRGAQPYFALRVGSPQQLEAVRQRARERGLPLLPNPSAAFAPAAFALCDPDGRLVVFGLPRGDIAPPAVHADLPASRLPARLQHVVVASDALPEMLRFYEADLGFVVSDYVHEDEAKQVPTVGFFRTDPEHHTFAVFRSPQTRPDHHAYETTCWNDLRDWADHLASLHIKLWWGPGRHGPGNNLFFMIQDPQGYRIEFSAELEVVPDEVEKRSWKHEERTLNLWGGAFMRS